ncbi:nuclear pore complex protein GP210-like [Camellia sinensis]|uniref:nuclear pore complex protein GP210-like n=1 Tax=Camellia sinensis TaxID=4442 RepID=UPI001036C21E|nr:nuclear pore complex protein GP210-like [Camellia sinensis]
MNGSNRGKKDAMTTLYKLCMVKVNKERAVKGGAVKAVVGLVATEQMAEKAMVVMSSLAAVAERKEAIVEEGGIAALVEVIEDGSPKGKEFAVMTLLQLCGESVRNRGLLVREDGIPPLAALAQTGTTKAKHKAETLLRSWDHHDILSVLPEFNSSGHCSTSARLRSIASYSGRKETAVYATDVHTGMVIRCKVYIDNFSRIQIFHNSIKLDLDGLATLHVRAFDDEENVFSSLVGLQFMWHLMPEANGLPHHLVHVPLKDSPLSDCGGLCGDLDIQTKLEDSGVFSDLYVVKGTGIGHEIVSVHLLEPQFEHMADKIVLTVAEAMSLDPPSPVFVLIDATVHYCLKVIRGNIPQGP